MKRSIKQAFKEKVQAAYMKVYVKEQQPIIMRILKSRKELECIFDCLEKTPNLMDPAVQFAFSALRVRVGIIMNKEPTNQEFTNIFGLMVICLEEMYFYLYNKPVPEKVMKALSIAIN